MGTQDIVIDFEMNPVEKTNRDARKHLHREIIEIGAVRLNEEHAVADRFHCYVKPQFSKNIAPFITDLTGITTVHAFNALSFEAALDRLAAWIGFDRPARIFSWSDADLKQLRAECRFKRLALPQNLADWVDFQAVYAQKMYEGERRQPSLHTAAEQFGIRMDDRRSHSALYDAGVTAELLISVLTGEYLRQKELLAQNVQKAPPEQGCSIGDRCGAILQQLLYQMAAGQEAV